MHTVYEVLPHNSVHGNISVKSAVQAINWGDGADNEVNLSSRPLG